MKKRRVKCSSPACDRDATIGITKGRPLCQAHYRRMMRGRPVDTPIRPRESDLTELPGCRVPEEIAKIMHIAARLQKVSLYELQRKINEEWAENALGG